MTSDQLIEIIKSDGSLCNARYHRHAESIASHVTEHYGPVSIDEVVTVLDGMKFHPRTAEAIGHK